MDSAVVAGNAIINDSVQVLDSAQIKEFANLQRRMKVCGLSQIIDTTIHLNDGIIADNSLIDGDFKLEDYLYTSGSAKILSDTECYTYTMTRNCSSFSISIYNSLDGIRVTFSDGKTFNGIDHFREEIIPYIVRVREDFSRTPEFKAFQTGFEIAEAMIRINSVDRRRDSESRD